MKTRLWLTLLLPALTLFARETAVPAFKAVTVDFINIHGKTNVNSFRFYLNSGTDSGNNEIAYAKFEQMENARLNIPVKHLQTDNEYMYADFLTLLKEPEHPEISIAIDESSIQLDETDAQTVELAIYLTIAGVTNRYLIQCTFTDYVNAVLLKGTMQIKLTDFDLVPPSKMFGLVKVKDDIDIIFGILLGDESKRGD